MGKARCFAFPLFFMTKSKLPKSVRKYIRREKANIRQMFSGSKEVEQKLKELSIKFFSKSNTTKP